MKKGIIVWAGIMNILYAIAFQYSKSLEGFDDYNMFWFIVVISNAYYMFSAFEGRIKSIRYEQLISLDADKIYLSSITKIPALRKLEMKKGKCFWDIFYPLLMFSYILLLFLGYYRFAVILLTSSILIGQIISLNRYVATWAFIDKVISNPDDSMWDKDMIETNDFRFVKVQDYLNKRYTDINDYHHRTFKDIKTDYQKKPNRDSDTEIHVIFSAYFKDN